MAESVGSGRQTPGCNLETERRIGDGRTLGNGLGWFSIGLGLYELLAPGTIETGQTHVQAYHDELLTRIEKGEIDPSFVITHKAPIEQGPGHVQDVPGQGRRLHQGGPQALGLIPARLNEIPPAPARSSPGGRIRSRCDNDGTASAGRPLSRPLPQKTLGER
ncbi:MAG TPA: hypothetical protein VF006_11020 [Longimicrobium sp.]